MNTDELIEQIHRENALLRKSEQKTHPALRAPLPRGGDAWRIVVPVAAAAAILLIVLLPRERTDVGTSGNTTYASAGIYCNSQCNPDDVLALIDNNINHIRTIQAL